MKKNLNILLVGLAVLSMSSCKSLYGKYERPDVTTAIVVGAFRAFVEQVVAQTFG